MGGYVARGCGPITVDCIDPDDSTPISTRWAPYLKSLNLTSLSGAVWSTDDGITLSNQQLVADEDGNLTIAQAIVDVTTAPLHSWVDATCQVTTALGTHTQSLRMQVAQR